MLLLFFSNDRGSLDTASATGVAVYRTEKNRVQRSRGTTRVSGLIGPEAGDRPIDDDHESSHNSLAPLWKWRVTFVVVAKQENRRALTEDPPQPQHY